MVQKNHTIKENYGVVIKLFLTNLKCTFLFISLCILQTAQSQNFEGNIYDEIKQFKTKESLPVEDIIELDKKNFTGYNPKTIYQELAENTWWFKFKNKKGLNYFTLSFPYLSYGKMYISTKDSVITLPKVSYSKNFPHKYIFYRHPVWKIPKNLPENATVYLEVKNNGGRTRLEFHLENENQFLNRIQNEYLLIGVFVSFLIAMIIILLYFSILKKEYSVIFYSIYVGFMLIEFLAGKGLGIQYIWSENLFFIQNIRSLSQTSGTLFIGLFYLYFYKFNPGQNRVKYPFKIGILISFIFLIVYLYIFIFGGLSTFYLLVWLVLKLVAVSWFIIHLFLARKNQIPYYLIFAFSVPIIAIVTNQNINPSIYAPNWWKYLSTNLYYIALIIEILLFTRYIFFSVVKTQKKYELLKIASEKLKYNFQNKTLEIQQQERNELLSNVHDSFGGYLEALKLRLLNKPENNADKIKEILDSFYKEYRYLLNSLYSPKINFENFIESLEEFIEKLNELTSNKIVLQYSFHDSALSQEICLQLYRIISEILTNAVKHSKAPKIEINIKSDEHKSIILEINDNGVGFDVNRSNFNSYGLKNIELRVHDLNGEFKIDSTKNIGTNIFIRIPSNE